MALQVVLTAIGDNFTENLSDPPVQVTLVRSYNEVSLFLPEFLEDGTQRVLTFDSWDFVTAADAIRSAR